MAQRYVSKIRELRKRALAHRTGMTAGAVAPGWVIENLEAARLLRAQRRLVPQPGVEFTGVRIKLCCALLVGLERQQHPFECQIGLIENLLAKGAAKLRRVATPLHLAHHGRGIGIRHLERRQQRQHRLAMR